MLPRRRATSPIPTCSDSPAFVHLRLHSDSRSPMARCASTTRSRRLRRRHARARAHRSRQPVRPGQVLPRRARARASSRSPVATCGSRTRPSATSRFARCCCAATRDGYLKLCDWLTRAYRHEPASRPRGDPPRMVRRGHRRPHRAVGRARRRRRPGAPAGQRDRRRASCAREWARAVPATATTSRCSARAAPTTMRWSRATVALAGELALPVVATHPVQFLEREDFRAHEARVCIAEGHVLADARRPRRFTAEQYFVDAGGDGGEVRRPARGAREQRRDRAALQPDDPARQEPPSRFSRRRQASRSTSTSARKRRAGLERAPRALYPGRRRARARDGPSTPSALAFETKTIVQMGFAGYFLIVADFINWAKRERRAGGARPRLGRRLARRVLRSASPTSTRCATSCCSSASSIPSACRCRTSTSTSARTAATA